MVEPVGDLSARVTLEISLEGHGIGRRSSPGEMRRGTYLLIWRVSSLVWSGLRGPRLAITTSMIRKLQSGEYRLYSRKKDAKTGKRKNLGTFRSLEAARKHERAVQFFKRH